MKGLLLLLSALLAASTAWAHDVSYSYVDLHWDHNRIELSITMHRDDLAPALQVSTPDSLLEPGYLSRHADRIATLVTSRFRVEGVEFQIPRVLPSPERGGVTMTFAATGVPSRQIHVRAALFPENPQHQTFLNVYDAKGGVLAQEILRADHTTAEAYAAGPEGMLAVLATFLRAGIHHIFIGPDHILFIVGLLLLGGTLKRVLQVATSFTGAHSITLALAVLGIVQIPGRIVEPIIALSIVYVGFENLRARESGRDWRTRIAFAFGLIHGFGFASVLREFGLAHQALAWSLLGFNLGVELGQVCIVLAIVPLLAGLRAATPKLATRTVASTSWLIIVTGGFWFVQRVLAGG